MKTQPKGRQIVLLVLVWALVILSVAGFFLAKEAKRIYEQYAYPVAYEDLVLSYARQRDLEPSLVFAVICCESGFQPEAQSSVGAKGLMQLMDETFEWAQMRNGDTEFQSPTALYDPETNIRYGTLVLSLLLEEFEHKESAIAAYHAGWGNVKEWLDNGEYSQDGETLSYIPFEDTRSYVDKVLRTQEEYRRLYGYA